MNRQIVNIIKDLIISVLIVVCIIVAISVVLYDKISLSKIIPQAEEYVVTEEMQEALDDSISDEEKESITKYYVDAVDLKISERTNEYNKGKLNPFAVVSPDYNGIDQGGFYDDDGTK